MKFKNKIIQVSCDGGAATGNFCFSSAHDSSDEESEDENSDDEILAKESHNN